MRFQSSGHTTAALRALSYASPSAKFKDMTNGIDFYQFVADLSEHFEERKDELTQVLETLEPADFPGGPYDGQLYCFPGWLDGWRSW